MQTPAWLRINIRSPQRSLDIDQAIFGHQVSGRQLRTDGIQQALTKRRIKKDNIVLAPSTVQKRQSRCGMALLLQRFRWVIAPLHP